MSCFWKCNWHTEHLDKCMWRQCTSMLSPIALQCGGSWSPVDLFWSDLIWSVAMKTVLLSFFSYGHFKLKTFSKPEIVPCNNVSKSIQCKSHSLLGWEDPLEKGMATHSSILAWRIPWTEEPGGLQSMGSQRVRPYWANNTFTFPLVRISAGGAVPLFSFLFVIQLLAPFLVLSDSSEEGRWRRGNRKILIWDCPNLIDFLLSGSETSLVEDAFMWSL